MLDSVKANVATTTTGRGDFIQKTYLHLLGAVLAFVAVEVVLFQTGVAMAIGGVLASNWLFTLGGFILVSWLASYLAAKIESLPMQYLGLGLFILAEAVIFTPLLLIAVYYAGPSVLMNAIYTTVAGFAALTTIVFWTKHDFSFLQPFLMIVGLGALAAIVGATIFEVDLGFYFSIGMVVFACAAILYDTSKILRDYNENQYVIAALQLFASVALLFWYVLSIFLNRD